uniref:Uncharacterized protein n=1 Tax=Parascaris equorum TaxID=6256 RepID=A0A914S0D0_PAREQ
GVCVAGEEKHVLYGSLNDAGAIKAVEGVEVDARTDRHGRCVVAYLGEERLRQLAQSSKQYLLKKKAFQMFVCDAACLDAPLGLESTKVHVPVKVTRPATPILYLSKSRQHLEQLRGTIHVIEVGLF